jgi:hypothetical protein
MGPPKPLPGGGYLPPGSTLTDAMLVLTVGAGNPCTNPYIAERCRGRNHLIAPTGAVYKVVKWRHAVTEIIFELWYYGIKWPGGKVLSTPDAASP